MVHIDRYTLLDTASGAFFATRRYPIGTAIAFSVGFEVASRFFAPQTPGRSQANFEQSALNVLACVAGWATVQTLRGG